MTISLPQDKHGKISARDKHMIDKNDRMSEKLPSLHGLLGIIGSYHRRFSYGKSIKIASCCWTRNLDSSFGSLKPHIVLLINPVNKQDSTRSWI